MSSYLNFKPVQNPRSIAGCKRARSYSFDEESQGSLFRNLPVGARVGIGSGVQGGSTFLQSNRFLPMGGAISSICGSNVSHGPQRLFVKNSFSSSVDVSTATPVVPEDKELPATKATPPTRLSLGNETIGMLSGGMFTGCDSAPAINRVSPELPMRITGASTSSAGTNSGTVKPIIE